MTPSETKTDLGGSPVWPKHPDGRNMRLGEMTPEERRAQIKASVQRIADRLYDPRTEPPQEPRP